MASTRHGEALEQARQAQMEVSREVRALEALTLLQLRGKHLGLFNSGRMWQSGSSMRRWCTRWTASPAPSWISPG